MEVRRNMLLSKLYGMHIYTDRGHHIGSVKDVVIDDGERKIVGLALGHREGKVASISYEDVIAVGDIVLVRSRKSQGAEGVALV